MQYADSISSILKWQAGLFQHENQFSSCFSLKNVFVFPNQAAYIVDCRNGKIMEASGIGTLFGYKD